MEKIKALRKVTGPIRFTVLLIAMLVVWGLVFSISPTQGQGAAGWQQHFSYISPRPNAEMVSPSTTIAVRGRSLSGAALLDDIYFRVNGARSGRHYGETILAEDGQTVIFKPLSPFHFNERVTVLLDNGEESFSYSFQIAAGVAGPVSGLELLALEDPARIESRTPDKKAAEASPLYRTAPPNLPRYNVTKEAGTVGDGYVFISPFDFPTFGSEVAYLLILDDEGQPVYYQQFDEQAVIDFKRQPNGQLTYYDRAERRFIALNNQYGIDGYYEAGNGYPTNMHDLQILDNGHFLLTIYDSQIIDMSTIVDGGQPDAQVLGCIVQELDAAGNVVFEWRSWDHFNIFDTTRDLTFDLIDYVHCNSIERDSDGHLLLSSRNFDEITKIDRQSGDIIWRMGGKKDEFNFREFSRQHDARRLANGHLTFYDNGVTHDPQRSRGLEIEVDEVNKSVTVVREFRDAPDNYARYMGNVQRLSNGNSVIGWGFSDRPTFSEFDPIGNKILEFNAVQPDVVSYRSFRFPWQGYPAWPPALIANAEGRDVELFFSWNGSTETSGYMIFASHENGEETHVATVAKDGFENTYNLQAPTDGVWEFKVVAINDALQPTETSNVVALLIGGQSFYLPMIGARD